MFFLKAKRFLKSNPRFPDAKKVLTLCFASPVQKMMIRAVALPVEVLQERKEGTAVRHEKPPLAHVDGQSGQRAEEEISLFFASLARLPSSLVHVLVFLSLSVASPAWTRAGWRVPSLGVVCRAVWLGGVCPQLEEEHLTQPDQVKGGWARHALRRGRGGGGGGGGGRGAEGGERGVDNVRQDCPALRRRCAAHALRGERERGGGGGRGGSVMCLDDTGGNGWIAGKGEGRKGGRG